MAFAETAAERIASAGATRQGTEPLPIARAILQRQSGLIARLVALAGLAVAELLGHLLAHLLAALLQRLDGVLFGVTGRLVLALTERLAGVPHSLVGLAQAWRDFAGQVAELLHHLAQRAAQRLLDALIGFALLRLVAGLRAGGRGLLGGSGLIRALRLVAALGVIEQAALPADHVLHRAHLLLPALPLLRALHFFGGHRPRVAQRVQHLLKLRHPLLGGLHVALPRRLLAPARPDAACPAGSAAARQPRPASADRRA